MLGVPEVCREGKMTYAEHLHPIESLEDIEMFAEFNQAIFMGDFLKEIMGMGDKGIKDLLRQLPKLERTILELRFGFWAGRKITQEEVAREFGVSRHEIQQVEGKAKYHFRQILLRSLAGRTR